MSEGAGELLLRLAPVVSGFDLDKRYGDRPNAANQEQEPTRNHSEHALVGRSVAGRGLGVS